MNEYASNVLPSMPFEVSAIVQNKYSLVYERKSLVVGGICGTN